MSHKLSSFLSFFFSLATVISTLLSSSSVISFSASFSLLQFFPHSSAGEESTCDVGDLGSIPGSERSQGEGIGYPLQYSWASLVAQLVKNLPAMWETWVRPLGWEDALEKETATHYSILAWRIPWTKSMRSQRVRQD